ncbi:MAG TPA: rhomboid family intramembrane serine protease [Solirubrobacteraceae bacterium]|jgi:membrane associated rhomboid family serine protease|nr:rhomboid family intramembrane serine protease [Solirubrobacteraceae bacterium]
MTPTSVGMRCPECARDRTKVRTMHRSRGRWGAGSRSATEILIAINVIVFLAEVVTGVSLFSGTEGGWVYIHGVLFGPALTSHDPYGAGTDQFWRLLTAGFLHASLIHIGLNMLSLWFVGRVLEPGIGRRNFVAIYFASLFAGSFGALLFQPRIPTLGASTAIFGIFGALIVVANARRIPVWQSGLMPVLLLNFVFTLTYAGVSIGGHLGGLIGGVLCGYLVIELDERRGKKGLALAGCALVAVVSIAAGIAVAGGTGLTPNGFTL